jgi:hypothetical protein
MLAQRAEAPVRRRIVTPNSLLVAAGEQKDIRLFSSPIA